MKEFIVIIEVKMEFGGAQRNDTIVAESLADALRILADEKQVHKFVAVSIREKP